MSDRYLIVGLGNPGLKYKKTRHNIGFMVAERTAQEFGARFKKGRGAFESTDVHINNSPVLLVKPHTYMNNSGIVVAEIVKYYDIDLSQLLIIFDEVELPFGRFRLRKQGGSGGHNGLNSIIQHLNTKEFARLRIGIGTEYAKRDMTKFVLSGFSRNERKELDPILDRATKVVVSLINDGIDKTMNTFNQV